MPDECRLWTSLSSAGPRTHPHAEPIAYLHFAGTGLLVGLPDEPGVLIEADGTTRTFALREADAAGLGLTAFDLASGVALCSGSEGELGWRCTPVDLVVGEAALSPYTV